ncbi:hypothetical protein BH18ACT8_BH18ACT8_16820 [soil metagenome]
MRSGEKFRRVDNRFAPIDGGEGQDAPVQLFQRAMTEVSRSKPRTHTVPVSSL